ncbi:unnamed protein product [Victoria cruziana]
MISFIMPPRDQISGANKMLDDEFGTASNIKSRVNRQSVLAAITTAQQRPKLYNKVPSNGLVLYTGNIVSQDGKEKKFHTEALNELLGSDKFGFIVMDGNGALFGTLSGNSREVLHQFQIDLPRNMEQEDNLVSVLLVFGWRSAIINPAKSQLNVAANLMFDQRLQEKVLNIVDVSYGGESGFNQAIEMSSAILSNVKFMQENNLIGKYFEGISQDTGKYAFGVDDTVKALEMGAVDTLIAWENLDVDRLTLKNGVTGDVIIKHLTGEQEADRRNFIDKASSAVLEVADKTSLLEWFADEHERFGCSLQFVTNKSREGSQFCRGFGGIGGLLRYQLDLSSFDGLSDDEEALDNEDDVE